MAEMIEISRLSRDVVPAIPRRLALDGPVSLRGIRGSNVGMSRLPRLMATTRNLLHRREYPLARAPSGYLAAFRGVSRSRRPRNTVIPNECPLHHLPTFLTPEICIFRTNGSLFPRFFLSLSLSLSLFSHFVVCIPLYTSEGYCAPRTRKYLHARAILNDPCLSDLALLYFFAPRVRCKSPIRLNGAVRDSQRGRALALAGGLMPRQAAAIRFAIDHIPRPLFSFPRPASSPHLGSLPDHASSLFTSRAIPEYTCLRAVSAAPRHRERAANAPR